MKHIITINGLRVGFENISEAVAVIQALGGASASVGSALQKDRKHKKHKKHNFTKKCEICGFACKGNPGLALHKSKKHGMRSPNYEKNRKYWQQKEVEGVA